MPKTITLPQKGDALILVDVQNDFLPGGRLAVPGGNQIIPVLNRYIEIFQNQNLPIVATRDWHPQDHCSFKSAGGIWPTHCVAGTKGADFAPELHLPKEMITISKATGSGKDAYSGLDGTDLHSKLKHLKVNRVWVGGLATEYCVLQTVKDFLSLGYQVNLLGDAIRAINALPGDGLKAEKEMKSSGAQTVRIKEIC